MQFAGLGGTWAHIHFLYNSDPRTCKRRTICLDGGKANHLGSLLPHGTVLCLPNETTGTSRVVRNCSYLTGGGELRKWSRIHSQLPYSTSWEGSTRENHPHTSIHPDRIWKWHTQLKWWLKSHSYCFHLGSKATVSSCKLETGYSLNCPSHSHPPLVFQSCPGGYPTHDLWALNTATNENSFKHTFEIPRAEGYTLLWNPCSSK